MLHLRPERFPKNSYQKLGLLIPFLFYINLDIYNAYFLDLPNDMNITPTFNVEDLSPYQGPSKPFTLPSS